MGVRCDALFGAFVILLLTELEFVRKIIAGGHVIASIHSKYMRCIHITIPN